MLMKKIVWFLILVSILPVSAQSLFDQSNLTAWCIVPFDSENRTPVERLDMLKRLGFSQYVYDWRAQHLATFQEEIKQAKKHKITIEGVWIFIDENTDKVGSLSADNQEIIEIVTKNKLPATFWLGFNNNFFEGLSHNQKLEKGAEMLTYLHNLVEKNGNKIALYNHGDWFGEPENEIEIIKKAALNDVGLVYSFHHGHHQINRFHSMLNAMLPYLVAINLNGMDISKKQILTIGDGKSEKEMIQMIVDSGYKGRIGVLGHIMEEDVEVVLKRNLNGLKEITGK